MGFLDDALERQRQRRDPIGRLPWPAHLVALLLLVALALLQVLLGRGVGRALGLLLLVAVVPAQAVSTWASWKVAQERRAGQTD